MKKFEHRVKSFADVMAIIAPGYTNGDKKAKHKICHKCGSNMELIPGTNVFRCIGGKLKDGEVCANTTISHRPHNAA